MLSEKTLYILDTLRRKMANASHKAYQSPIERKKKYMSQKLVNKILGMYGDN